MLKIKKICCALFGHKIKMAKKVTAHVSEYQCSCCKTKFSTNTFGGLSELTEVMEETNSLLEQMYTKKKIKNEMFALANL